MSPLPIPLKRLTSEHNFLPFDCGDKDLNSFFVDDAIRYQNELLAVTYYLETKEETVLFFSLLNDKITAIDTEKSFWRRLKGVFPYSKHRKDYPAVKIGRLGVNTKFQNSDLKFGTHILDYIKYWMIAENKTGCRFITVDAYRDAVNFYLKNGFMFMGRKEKVNYEKGKSDTIALYFDLMQIKYENS
jgi:hypothetical protein